MLQDLEIICKHGITKTDINKFKVSARRSFQSRMHINEKMIVLVYLFCEQGLRF
jgi:hypothetical protein